MSKRWEVILAGAGGQGLVVAGSLLGEVAVRYAGMHATTAQAFGVASRGGLARSEVVISDCEITYPFAIDPDVVVALTDAAFRQMWTRCGPSTRFLVDSRVPEISAPAIAVPFVDAAERLGRSQDANMVAVGAVIGLLKAFAAELVVRGCRERFGADDHRLHAVEAGLDLGHDLTGMSLH